MRKQINSSIRVAVVMTIAAITAVLAVSAAADPSEAPTDGDTVTATEVADEPEEPAQPVAYSPPPRSIQPPLSSIQPQLENVGIQQLSSGRTRARATARSTRLEAVNGPYVERKAPVRVHRARPRLRIIPPSVEQWRPLVEAYFPAGYVNWAMQIMTCESGGDPNATNRSSGAAGLFQFLPRYWAGRAANAGFAGASPYDPTANVATAAWLLETGGESHWECKASK
jgi:transglycosylase-like protein with SLT domain